jgi:hypothetical protein
MAENSLDEGSIKEGKMKYLQKINLNKIVCA